MAWGTPRPILLSPCARADRAVASNGDAFDAFRTPRDTASPTAGADKDTLAKIYLIPNLVFTLLFVQASFFMAETGPGTNATSAPTPSARLAVGGADDHQPRPVGAGASGQVQGAARRDAPPDAAA